MWFPSWLRNQTVSPKRQPARRFRPRLEVLEDRAVPAMFLVNTDLDVLGHDNGMLSLRQAVIDANSSHGADTIVLRAGTYTLTRAGINEDAALTGDLDITGHLTIQGAGAGATAVDAAGLDRVFDVLAGGTVSIQGMTIQGGIADDGGGGIRNAGTLTINNSALSNNFAYGYGGGGILNRGTLTVYHSTLSGNAAYYVGGGIANSGTLTVRDSTLSSNSATSGGGIDNRGWLTVNNSTFSGNFAAYFGGGIATGYNDTNPYSNNCTLTNCTLSGNSTNEGGGEGGGLFVFGVTTVHNSTLSGNSAGRGGGIVAYWPLTINNSTLTGNSAHWGGGIDNLGTLTVNNSTVSANSATPTNEGYGGRGGGIFNDMGATLTVSNSIVSGNAALEGGGIYNYLWATLTVSNSMLASNAASQGGGIYNYSDPYDHGTVTVLNSTLTGNTASVFGGGIANFGTLTVKGSTLLGNSASLGGDLYNAGVVYLFNSLIDDRYDV